MRDTNWSCSVSWYISITLGWWSTWSAFKPCVSLNKSVRVEEDHTSSEGGGISVYKHLVNALAKRCSLFKHVNGLWGNAVKRKTWLQCFITFTNIHFLLHFQPLQYIAYLRFISKHGFINFRVAVKKTNKINYYYYYYFFNYIDLHLILHIFWK